MISFSPFVPKLKPAFKLRVKPHDFIIGAKRLVHTCGQVFRYKVAQFTKPASHSLLVGTVTDLSKSKTQLIMGNALLRQQLIVLRQQIKRPQLTSSDRCLMVLLASKLQTWKSALFIVQPDTLLRWHRQGFRLFWKRKSRANSRERKLPVETIALIKQMAQDNRLWGAERIRGELLKLDIRVCKRTIQKYMRQALNPRPSERKQTQNWTTFLHNHASQVWACDFLPVYDLFFRPLFVFFIIELGSRRVVHFRVTRCPTDEWVAHQLREATPYGQALRFLIRDNDSKFGGSFTGVAAGSGIKVLRTPFKAPRANAVCERFLGSVRRECLDHILVFGEKHLHKVTKEYVCYYNQSRPHQGIGQAVPAPIPVTIPVPVPILQVAKVQESQPAPIEVGGKVISLPVLGGLHHDYRRVA